MEQPDAIDGFTLDDAPLEVNHDGAVMSHWTYHGPRQGANLVILHELPGMSPACIALARRFIEHGFTVHLPLLFGQPGEFRLLKNFARICISREIHAFAANKTSPLVSWLRILVAKLHEDSVGAGVGVIGMCLTGNFALTLIAEPAVGAAVACQPSLPVFRAGALAMSPRDLSDAASRARSIGYGSVIGFRYAGDRLCGAQKFDAISEAFGSAFDGMEVPGGQHATLTEDFDQSVFDRTLTYLQGRLMP